MDYRAFEQRLLDTIFTTDVQLTPATIAFLYKLSVQEAADLLQQAAVAGLLNIESDDEGNLLYTYPNRTRLSARDPGQQNGSSSTQALVRPDPSQRETAMARLEGPPPAPMVYAESLPAEVSGPPSMVRCPFCNETIVAGAKKCKHCHEYLDYALRDIHSRGHGHGHGGISQISVALQPGIPQAQLTQWTGTQAALLSFMMPGLGQMCSGRVPAGLLWMMFTVMGYFCALGAPPLFLPAFILHLLCIINASRQPRQLS